jgi:MFS family permease
MRILAPLRQPRIALLWGGLATSSVGDQLYAVAIAWIAVEAFGPAAGYLAAIQAAVTIATALLFGAWADTQEDRALMIGADLTRAAALLVLIALWFAGGSAAAAGLGLAVVILAAGQALFRPTVQRVLPRLVPNPTLLPAANALFDATERIARLLGPGLIAVLASLIPQIHFLTLDAITFLVSAISVWRIGPIAAMPRIKRGPILANIKLGFAAMGRDPMMRTMLQLTGLNYGTWYMAIFLGIPLLLAGPGDSIARYGLVISSYGVGNLAANLAVGSINLPRRTGRLIFGGNLLNGTGIMLMAIAAAHPGAMMMPALTAAAALAGAGGPMSDLPRAVLMQSLLPHAEIAAAMRAWMVANYTGLLLAMALAPALIEHTGAEAATILCGAGTAWIGVYGMLRHWRHVPVA